MIRFFMIFIILIVFVSEFWFLTDLNRNQNLDSININTQKLSPLHDQNISVENFFDRDIWRLTKVDQYKEVEDKNESVSDDMNMTIAVINRKNSKQLCRGKRCMTIKGFVSDILLLEDGDEIVALKPSQVIFDILKFVSFTDTRIFFENNQSGEIYELEFFTYDQIPDTNSTEKHKDTK